MNNHPFRVVKTIGLAVLASLFAASPLFGQLVRSCTPGGPVFYLSGDNPFCAPSIIPLRILVEGVSGTDVNPNTTLCNTADPSGTFSLA